MKRAGWKRSADFMPRLQSFDSPFTGRAHLQHQKRVAQAFVLALLVRCMQPRRPAAEGGAGSKQPVTSGRI